MREPQATEDRMTTFLLRLGHGSLRRKAHIAKFDVWGEVAGAWCGRTGHNLTSNVQWGRPRCKDCIRRMRSANV